MKTVEEHKRRPRISFPVDRELFEALNKYIGNFL